MARKWVLLGVALSALWLCATGGAAFAGFVAVGQYDPPSANDVDQSATPSGGTLNGGAWNVVDLATFQALVGPAFAADSGGVIAFESSGSLDTASPSPSFTATFGASGTKSLQVTSGNTSFVFPGYFSDGRVPVSGTDGEMLSKDSGSNDFSFNPAVVTGGAPTDLITHFGFTAIDRDGANQGTVTAVATFTNGGTARASATMTGGGASSDEDTFFGFVAPTGESITNVAVNFSTLFMNVDDVGFLLNGPGTPLVAYRQPFYSNDTTDRPHNLSGWTALVETSGGVEDYVWASDNTATGISRSNGSANILEPINATTEVPGPTQRGYVYYAPKSDGDVPVGAHSLHFTGDVPDIGILDLLNVSFETRNDNEDAVMRLALQIGGQWYASALDFGDDGTANVWTEHAFGPASFADAALWQELDVTSSGITLGAPLAADLAGTVTDFGLYIDAGRTPEAGDHARLDNFTVVARAPSQDDRIPEPATLTLLAIGGLALLRRRKRAA